MPNREEVQGRRVWMHKTDRMLVSTYADPELDMIICSTCGGKLADRIAHGRLHVDDANDIFKDDKDDLFIACYWCGGEVKIPRNPKRRHAIDWSIWRHVDIETNPRSGPVNPNARLTPFNLEPYIWRKRPGDITHEVDPK